MRKLAVLLLLLGLLPALFTGADTNTANFVYDLCNMLMMPAVLLVLFSFIPKDKLQQKALAVCLFLGFSFKALNYIFFMLSVEHGLIVYLVTMFISMLFIARVFYWSDVKSDEYKGNKCYFVFKKPKNFIDFVITCFKLPVSSFSVIRHNKWYRYSRDVEGLYSVDLSGLDLNLYILKEVKSLPSYLLDDLVGSKWRLVDNNCVTVFRGVFNYLSIKIGRFDFIPSLFTFKYLKNHDNKIN